MTDNENPEQQGEQNVPPAWRNAAESPPPPPPPAPPVRPSVEPPTAPEPWAQHAAETNPLRNPTPLPSESTSSKPASPVPPSAPPSAPLGQTIGSPPAQPPIVSPPTVAAPQIPTAPVTASAAQPVLSGDYGLTPPPEAPEVSSSSSKLPWVAAVLAALVLLGGGGFFALTAFTSTGGADSPEEAADAMFEAINNEDFVTLGELIEPSERRTIVEPLITEILPELQRLDVLSDEADASNVEGVDLEFSDLTYRVEAVPDAPDMMHVFLTGGEFATEFNAAEFPFSDEYREMMGDDLQDDPRSVEPIEPSELPLTFVERDGKWYFSGWFSFAEAARIDAGERLPLASEAPPALGSDSPEAAVEAMMDEIVELDLAGMIGRMDPDEQAALYRYSPLFIADGQGGLDEFRQFLNEENIAWDIRDFDFEVEADGDDAIVTIRSFTFDITSPDFDLTMTYGREAISASVNAGEAGSGSLEATLTRWTIEGVVDGEPFSMEVIIDPEAGQINGTGNFAGEVGDGEFTIDPEGVCSQYSVTFGGETEEGCAEDNMSSGDVEMLTNYETAFDQWPDEFPGIQISTRRTDGEWYVSPISTGFDGALAFMQALEDGQFEQFADVATAADPLSSANDISTVLDEVADASMGADDTDDLFADDTESLSASEIVQESTIAFTVDRGETGELADSISVGTYDLATIDLEAGDTITITVGTDAQSSLDTYLVLLFDGAVIAENDDAPNSDAVPSPLDSQLEVVVPSTGTYEFQIGSYEGLSAGDYTVSVSRS